MIRRALRVAATVAAVTVLAFAAVLSFVYTVRHGWQP